ncbi:MAG: PAS domain-containing protein, partial [Anaerolineae bacterium]|nr:PAS domain-containing protein [Anaerolineae bacterium]
MENNAVVDIHEEKHRLEQMLRHIPLAVAVVDRDMRYLFANDRWLHDFGLEEQHLDGLNHYDVFPEIDDDWKAIHQQCLQGEIRRDEQLPFVRADGSIEWLRREIRPWYGMTGAICGVIFYIERITDRKQTQDALKAQRNFLRQVIDLDTSFIFAKDEQGRFTLANEALATTYGTTPEAMVGKADVDFNPRKDETIHFRHDDAEVVRTRQPKFIPEEPLTNAVTGETRWYQTTKIPLIAEDGQPVQLLGVATDITDRKRAQDALKTQRNFLRKIIDLDTSFIFAKDEQGRFTLANKALATHYGTTPEEMVGKADLDFNRQPHEIEHLRRDDSEVIRTCQPKFIPEEALTNVVTGETRWYQTIKIPLISEDGQSVQLLGVATDITDRKRAQDHLETQRNFLRQVIDLNTSLIFTKDEHGQFTLVNKALADAYGTTPRDMVGKYDEDFNPRQNETEHFRHDDAEVVRNRQPKFIAEEPVTNVVTEETRWYQTVKVPLFAEDGHTVQLLGVATDITDRKRAQEQLQQLVIHEQKARKEAETSTKLKDLFLANMSHELRTPLNAIIGFLREMLYSEQLDHDNLHMAERCLANSQRLLMLINSVLDLSRLAAGSLEIVPMEISPYDLAHTIIDDLGLQAKEKGLRLELELDPALPETIVHDEERLIQITTNLVANAIKFTYEGTVKLAFRRQEDRLIITVSDTGIGIPKTLQKIIFENFVQLDRSSKRKHGGAGLGLSIVSNLVDLMGGQVSVESEVGRYSVFKVDIPLELDGLHTAPL